MKFLTLLALLACLFPAGGPARAEVVYRSQFGKAPAREWMPARISRTPSGRTFLGIFAKRVTASLQLAKLPPHRLLRVRCTLFQIYSPDGNQAKIGPDIWGLSVGGGAEIVRTTFNFSHAFEPKLHPQSFPDDTPVDHPAGTGADELGSLGYRFGDVPEQAEKADMVFKLDVVFPHDAPSVELQFWSKYTHPANDEAWGIESVEVEAVPEFSTHTEAEFGKLWAQLLGPDPKVAWNAVWKLAEAGPQTTEFLGRQLGSSGGLRERIAGLVRDLSSTEVLAQEKARAALEKLEPRALPVLRELLNDPKTPARIREEFGELVTDLKTESPIFFPRVTRLLRVLDSPAAEALLKSLTGLTPPGEIAEPFARLRWHGAHAVAEDAQVLRSAFSKDGRRLFTVSGEGVRTWDVESGRLEQYLLGPFGRSFAIAPDGGLGLLGSKTGQFALWDTSGTVVRRIVSSHEGEVWGAVALPDSKSFITGAADGLRWWQADNPIPTHTAPLIEPMRYLALSPDGKTLACAECGEEDRVVTLRDAATGELLKQLDSVTTTITCVAFSPDGKQLAASLFTGGVRLYDVEKGTEVARFAGALPQSEGVAFTPDGRYLCAGGGGGADKSAAAQAQRGLRLYRLSDGAEVWRLSNIVSSLLTVNFSPDGKLLAGTDSARNVYLWEVFRTPEPPGPGK